MKRSFEEDNEQSMIGREYNKYIRSSLDNNNDDTDDDDDESLRNRQYIGSSLRLSSIEETNSAQVVFDNDALLNILPSNINTENFQNDDDLDLSNEINDNTNDYYDDELEYQNKQYMLDKYRTEMAFKIEKEKMKYELDTKYNKEKAERSKIINSLQLQKDQMLIQYMKYHLESRYYLMTTTQYVISKLQEKLKSK